MFTVFSVTRILESVDYSRNYEKIFNITTLLLSIESYYIAVLYYECAVRKH